MCLNGRNLRELVRSVPDLRAWVFVVAAIAAAVPVPAHLAGCISVHTFCCRHVKGLHLAAWCSLPVS